VSLAWFLQFDYDSSAPPEQAWRRRLNSHANLLKEFRVTFMEAIKMASFFPLSLFLSQTTTNNVDSLV